MSVCYSTRLLVNISQPLKLFTNDQMQNITTMNRVASRSTSMLRKQYRQDSVIVCYQPCVLQQIRVLLMFRLELFELLTVNMFNLLSNLSLKKEKIQTISPCIRQQSNIDSTIPYLEIIMCDHILTFLLVGDILRRLFIHKCSGIPFTTPFLVSIKQQLSPPLQHLMNYLFAPVEKLSK